MYPYTSVQIANWFISKAKREYYCLTTSKLIKLVYIANGWHLALTNGIPLVSEDVQAWNWGPVFPELYHRIKRLGVGQVEELIWHHNNGHCEVSSIPVNDYDRLKLLEKIWEVYHDSNRLEMARMCIPENGPWNKRWKEMEKIGMTQSKIDPKEIEIFFKNLMKDKS